MFEKRPPLISSLLILTGLVLSLLSWTDLCNFGGCTEAHEYRFFSLPLPLTGTVYFSALALLRLAAGNWSPAGLLLALALAGGAGAELTMIHLQKNVIQAWCPLCLGIASTVYLLCILGVRESLQESRRLSPMFSRWFISRSLLLLVAAAAGFLVSFTGITKPEAAGPETYLGKPSSKIEVLIFSDWLCPNCIKVEPAIEAVVPQLEKRAKIHFIDKPIHKEAMNFVPYHLSFLVHEKAKYLQIRRALFTLAQTNRNPSLEVVKATVAPLGVTYRQLSFMEVSQMMGLSQALAAQYKVTGTPTVVVVNNTTRKSKSLVGGKDITADNIMKAVRGLE